MTFGIDPDKIDNLSCYELNIYNKLIPLYQEYLNTNMENCIKKAISEVFSG